MRNTLWTFWKAWVLAVPLLALSAPGAAEAVPHPGHPSRGIIFVADGAGGQGAMTDALMNLVGLAQLPLNVQQVFWSTMSEPEDFNNQLAFYGKGRTLANRIVDLHRKRPDAKIYLIGFGAGTTVILRAAECLPPNTATHIILLASSVSCTYDLRPALLSSCEGIDSFYNCYDEALCCAIKHHGTTDGIKGARSAAGLSGFHALSNFPRDVAIYCRLRQHPIHKKHKSPDHDKSCLEHLAYVHPTFLRQCVLSIIEKSLIHPGAYDNCPIPPAHQPPPTYTPPVPQYTPMPVPHYPPPAPRYTPPPAPQYSPPPAPTYTPPPAPRYSPPPAPTYTPPPAPRYSPPPAPPPPAPTYTPPQYPVPGPQYSPPPAPRYVPSPAPQYPLPPSPQCPCPPLPLPKGPETYPTPPPHPSVTPPAQTLPNDSPAPSSRTAAYYQGTPQAGRP